MLRFIKRRSFLTLLAGSPVLADYSGPSGSYIGKVPEDGMIPNEEVAKAIAKVIATAHYGEDVVNRELPLKAHLVATGQLWIVTGTRPPNDKGPAITIHIARHNGCIRGSQWGQICKVYY